MFTQLHTPAGMRGHPPSEVKNYRYVENRLREKFELWGYEEIRSPTIEFVQSLSTGIGSEMVDGMFKFQDSNGKIVALRSEMTAPVARMITTRIPITLKPIRLFYICNVFRNNPSRMERLRELWQAGVELVGCNTPEADGEILSLLISSLKQIGLNEVRVDVGHASLLKEMIHSTGLNEEKKSTLKRLLGYRAETRLEEFMEKNNVPSQLREAFLELSSCRRLKEVSSVSLSSLTNEKTADHLENLLEIGDVLSDYNVEKFVFFDFSLTRKIKYYTGMVFEASVPNLGIPLGGGGRYDDLLRKFGKLDLPATGFALGIERCLQALKSQDSEIPEKRKPRVLVSSKFRNTAVKTVKTLRDAGVVALLNLMKTDEEKIRDYEELEEIDYAIIVGSSLDEPLRVYDSRSNTPKKLMLENFLKTIRTES